MIVKDMQTKLKCRIKTALTLYPFLTNETLVLFVGPSLVLVSFYLSCLRQMFRSRPWSRGYQKEEFHIHLGCFGTLSVTLSTVVLYRFICQMQQAWEHPDPDPDKDPVQIQIQIQIQSRVPHEIQIAA